MHTNSLNAFHAATFTVRELEIINAIQKYGSSTDRQIKDILGFTDMNAVRPRISELIIKGKLEERGSQHDPVTKRNVRIVGFPIIEEKQLTFFS
jgi:hypothetical protein